MYKLKIFLKIINIIRNHNKYALNININNIIT